MLSRDLQLLTPLVPASAVADQHGSGTWCDLSADLAQVQIHRLDVGVRRDHGGADRTVWADGPEQIGQFVTVIAHHQRPRALGRPNVGVGSFLADAGLILEPYFYRRRSRGAEQRRFDQAGEVFLKAVSASASFFGWYGRGCRRLRPSWFNHLPIVCT